MACMRDLAPRPGIEESYSLDHEGSPHFILYVRVYVKCRYVEGAQYILGPIIIINNDPHGCWSLTYCLSALTPPFYTLLCEAGADSANHILQSVFCQWALTKFCQQGGCLQGERGGLASSGCFLSTLLQHQVGSITSSKIWIPPLGYPFPEVLDSDNLNLTCLFSQPRGGSFLLRFSLCYLVFPLCFSALPHQ